jgi:hypothetical protein
VVKDDPVSDEGTWERRDLPAGEYHILIVRADESVWFSETLELEPGAEEQQLAIHITRVSGRVAIGDSPLVSGKVMLAEEVRNVQAPFWIDDQGRFSGFFPSVDIGAARWHVTITTMDPPTHRILGRVQPDFASESLLRFSLALPASSIEGRVTDSSGIPRSAMVTAIPSKGPASEAGNLLQVRAHGSTGEFRIAGVQAGEYYVSARARGPGDPPRTLSSPTATVRVRRSRSPSPLELVLSDEPSLVGIVTTSTGAPVAGARVVVVPANTPLMMTTMQRTDAEGRFSASLPPGTRNVLVDISVPRVGRRILGRPVPEDAALTVELDPTGHLVLALGDPEADPPSAALYHDGGWLTFGDLMVWSQQNGEPTEAGVLRVPFMHAGPYRVCHLLGVEEYPQFMAATLPGKRCDEGTLWPGGELRLRVPPLPRSN